MAFHIGDRVRLLRTNEQAVVLKLLDQKKLIVIVEDFYEMEVTDSDLVSLTSQKQEIPSKNTRNLIVNKAVPDIKKAYISGSIDFSPTKQCVYIGISTDELHVAYAMINLCGAELLFTAWQKHNQHYKLIHSGSLAHGQCTELCTGYTTDPKPSLHIQMLYKRVEAVPELPTVLQVDMKVTNKDLLKEATYVPELRAGYILKEIKEKASTQTEPKVNYSKSRTSNSADLIDKPDEVIDLHIEQLTGNWGDMDNLEMIALQINTFQGCLDAAIVHGMPEIIFIHGVGKGILKNEIHNRLADYPGVQSYHIDTSGAYGYGATRVIL